MREEKRVAAQLAPADASIYTKRNERVALRAGMSSAAALCDALARDIAAENRGRGGKGSVTKQGLALESVAKRCGDAIWAMRELVEVPR